MAARSTTPAATQLSQQHLTVAQLAHRLNVSTDYLYREVLCQPGGINPIRLGRGPRARHRIPVAEVERWEESQRVRYGVVDRGGQR